VVLYFHLTTRVEGDPHQELMKEKGLRGWPSLAFLDEKGELVAVHDAPKTVHCLDLMADRVARHLALRSDPAANEAERIVLRFELGHLTMEQARVDFAFLPLPDRKTVRDRFEAAALAMDVRQAAAGARDRKLQVEAGKRLLDLKKNGKVPADPAAALPFWSLIMAACDEARDAKGYGEALGALKAVAGKDPALGPLLERQAKHHRFMELLARVQTDPSVGYDFVVAALEAGRMNAAGAKQALDQMRASLAPEQVAKIEALMFDAEIREAAAGARERAKQLEVGKTFLEWHRAGKEPGDDVVVAFWSLVMVAAEDAKDAKLYEEGLNAVRAKHGDDPGFEAWIEAREKQLRKMKGE
jgi:hypothetical protein